MEWSRLLCEERIRAYKKPSGKDLRSEFEMDYHRIIGSASFRRLQDKTQVFPLDESDFIRTRLTHSLEVSSFARSLGQNVSEKILNEIRDKSFLPIYRSYICEILQCVGLIHDIGNPPFGHFGETAIREWFIKNLNDLKLGDRMVSDMLNSRMKNDFYHFEGNTQAFRLVTKLHFLVDHHGMNLTMATLSAMMKYPVSSVEIDPSSGDVSRKKMGYFYADREDFLKVQEKTGTDGRRNPLTFLLEAADDIAYITADIEDAYKKAYISYTDLLGELEKISLRTKIPDYILSKLKDRKEKAIAKGYDDPEGYAVQNWVVFVQAAAINAVTDAFAENYQKIMDGSYRNELIKDSECSGIIAALGDIERRYVFDSKPIYKREIAEEVIINFLLDKFVDAAIVYDTPTSLNATQHRLMGIISQNYKSVYHKYSEGKSDSEKLYLRLLLVTDFVCGMTDSYARRLYQELMGFF